MHSIVQDYRQHLIPFSLVLQDGDKSTMSVKAYNVMGQKASHGCEDFYVKILSGFMIIVH